MILRKTWAEKITKNSLGDIIDTPALTLAQTLDQTMLTKFGIVTQTYNALSYIKTAYLINNDACVWKDLPIYLSSFKDGDNRIVYSLKDRLIKYLRFFNKMITDDGLARRMSLSRSFQNDYSDSGTNKNYFSETPQEELDNFETAIMKYASNLTKDTSAKSGQQLGTASETSTNVTWDEAMKNLRLVFYNDLMDFVSWIPNIIYNYYCLDSRPYPALVKEYYKGIIDVFHLENEC